MLIMNLGRSDVKMICIGIVENQSWSAGLERH